MTKEERISRFECIKIALEEEGYKAHEKTISVLKANIMAFVYAGPLAYFLMIVFRMVYKSRNNEDGLSGLFLLLGLLLVSVYVHELLHGVGWSKFCKNGWKSIHIGIMWKLLTPYCYCAEALSFRQYVFGGMLPFMVLGIGGTIIAFITGSNLIMNLAAINIFAAGGDITIMFSLLKHKKNKIIDHPTECGFWAFSND